MGSWFDFIVQYLDVILRHVMMVMVFSSAIDKLVSITTRCIYDRCHINTDTLTWEKNICILALVKMELIYICIYICIQTIKLLIQQGVLLSPISLKYILYTYIL